MMKPHTSLLLLLLLFVSSRSFALVKLPGILADGMVLQQQSKVKLWGWTKPLQKVLIQPNWSNKNYTAIADATGAWVVSIETSKAGGPYRISIDDGEKLILKDVLLGEVWLCSGQSNMVMPLKGYDKGQEVLNGAEVIAEAGKYQNIRVFDVPKVISADPLSDCKGIWKSSNPENAPGFSAIAFQYARILNEKLGVPVGLITACWGSTAIQSWMSNRSLSEFPQIPVSTRLDTMRIPAKDPESVCSVLFNSMINPVRNFRIRGFLWYQGESNKSPSLYQRLLPAMVRNWRTAFGGGRLPFYYVQIAPYSYTDRNTAFLREAQLNAGIPNSEMVVSLDAGQEKRIHPRNKTVLAERLANCALAETYNKRGIQFKSPELKSVQLNQSGAVVRFKNVYNGLKVKKDTLSDFQVAGSDGAFFPAKARIMGKSRIKLTCSKISRPVAVRYAFRNWAEGELVNSAGLPASSFRTDKMIE